MTTLLFPAPLLLLLPAGSTCPPLHIPRSPTMLVEMTATSITRNYVQKVSTDTGIILIPHTQRCFYMDQTATGSLVWKSQLGYAHTSWEGDSAWVTKNKKPKGRSTALRRDIWGKASYKQPVQTKQGFGDSQILCSSLPVPLPHLKRPCLPLQKPCLLRPPPFHRLNWPLPYRGKSHPGCQPQAVLSRLQKLPGRC